MALHKGFPDLRLQATVVSRWLVIPADNSKNLRHLISGGKLPMTFTLSLAQPLASNDSQAAVIQW